MPMEASAKKWLGILAAVSGAGLIVGGIAIAIKNSDKSLKAIDYKKRVQGMIGEKINAGGMTTTVYQGQIPIRERLTIMQEMVAKGVKDPEMIQLARTVTRDCPDRDKLCELKKIYEFKKRNLRYVADPAPHKLAKEQGGQVEPVDLFSTAKQSLKSGAEDCDGHAIVGATLATIVGIPTKFVVGSGMPSLMENYEHVWEEGEIDGASVPIDSTVPGDFFGILPPAAKRLGMEVVA